MMQEDERSERNRRGRAEEVRRAAEVSSEESGGSILGANRGVDD